MPRVSKYKSAGKAMGKYSESLSGVDSLGYARKNAVFKGEEQRSLYGNIGATAANILGIIKEQKELGKFNKLKKSTSGLPGVVKESQEYQRGGKIGELLGIGKGSRDVYKSRITGEELPDSTLYAIGKAESLSPGSTKYGETQVISDMLASGKGYNPVRDEAFKQLGVSSQKEYDEYYNTKFEDFPLSEYPEETDYLQMEMDESLRKIKENVYAKDESTRNENANSKEGREKAFESETKLLPPPSPSFQTKEKFMGGDQSQKKYSQIHESIITSVDDTPFRDKTKHGVSLDVSMQQKSKASLREAKPLLQNVAYAKTPSELEEYLSSDNEHVRKAAEKRLQEVKGVNNKVFDYISEDDEYNTKSIYGNWRRPFYSKQAPSFSTSK